MLHNPHPDPISRLNDLQRLVDTLVLENKDQWPRPRGGIPPVLPDYMGGPFKPPPSTSTTTGSTTCGEDDCHWLSIPSFTMPTGDTFPAVSGRPFYFGTDDGTLEGTFDVGEATYNWKVFADNVSAGPCGFLGLFRLQITASGGTWYCAWDHTGTLQPRYSWPYLYAAYPATITVTAYSCADPPPTTTTGTGTTTGTTTTGTTTSDCGWNSGVVAQQNWIATLMTVSGECRLVWTADPEVPANCGPGCEPNPPTTPPPYNPTTPNGDGASQATPCVPVGTAGPNDQYTLADWLDTCPDSTTTGTSTGTSTGTTTAGESCNLAEDSTGWSIAKGADICWAGTGTLTVSGNGRATVDGSWGYGVIYTAIYSAGAGSTPYITAHWNCQGSTFRLRYNDGSGETDLDTPAAISPTNGATYHLTLTLSAAGDVSASMTGTGVSVELSGALPTPMTGAGHANLGTYDPASILSGEEVNNLCVTGNACAGTGSGTGGA